MCEEASCPNIGECFGKGTATFMILGDLCTRRCPFCDVGHGKPLPPDADEPAQAGAHHRRDEAELRGHHQRRPRRPARRRRAAFRRLHRARCASCRRRPRIEMLVPDFRGRLDIALDILAATPPDVMNHNLETVPRLYKQARPGADYAHSLQLLKDFKARHPGIPTKSGLMVGLGETDEEILARDARPARARRRHAHHRPVPRALRPSPAGDCATCIRTCSRCSSARRRRWASRTPPAAPMVRSSYHADQQAHLAGVS